MEVLKKNQVSDEEIQQLHILVRQLSSGAKLLSTDEFNRLLQSQNLVLFTAETDDKIVGMLTLVLFQIPTGLRARIEDVVVLDEYRRRGIARMISERAILEYQQLSARSLDLTSSPSREAANSLYVSMGFEQRETNVYRYKD